MFAQPITEEKYDKPVLPTFWKILLLQPSGWSEPRLEFTWCHHSGSGYTLYTFSTNLSASFYSVLKHCLALNHISWGVKPQFLSLDPSYY